MNMGKVAEIFSADVIADTPTAMKETRSWPTAARAQSNHGLAQPTVLAPPGQQKGIRLALVDERPLRRALVVQLLTAGGADFSILAFSSPMEMLAAHTRGERIDIVLFNAGTSSLSDACVQQPLTDLLSAACRIPVAMLCDRQFPPETRNELHHVVEAMGDGLHAYLPTSLEPRVVVEALRLVCAGGRFLPPDALLGHLREACAVKPTGETLAAGAAPGHFTPRQMDVLSLLRQGRSNKAIGRALDMQESTVKVHVRQIMRKLNAANRTHAALMAEKLGLASSASAR